MTFAGAMHQTLVTAAPGDAVTNSALQIRRLLRRVGPSEIFARHIHHELSEVVFPLDAYPRQRVGADALTVIHLSMGDLDWFAWVLDLPGRFVVSYHNITPHEYFDRWDQATARALRFGRSTLPALADRTVLSMADSAYNGRELRAAGFRNIRVAGLVLDPSLLMAVEPDRAVLAATLSRTGPTVLHVGQLYPHKRAEFLIAGFSRLIATHPDATLVLAGNARLPAYRRAIHDYLDELKLSDRVVVTGSLSAEEMSAYYRSADVVVSASEHEGFCVPLVEAMAFGVPIVARACAAVPETASTCAVLVPAGASPTQFALAVAAVLDDRAAADALRRRGHRRAARFSLASSRARFVEALATVV